MQTVYLKYEKSQVSTWDSSARVGEHIPEANLQLAESIYWAIHKQK